MNQCYKIIIVEVNMEDLSSRIAELKQIIAEQEAYQRSPYNKYHYGHIWDAIAGDRSGLDAEAADEAAYRNMILQQKFQAEQNESNRQNALKIAGQNKSQQNDYNLSKARETLGNLAITRDTLKGQGKDYRTVDNQINSIIERYPELQIPESTKYDPTTSVDYKLAKYTPINSKSTRSDDIANAIEELKEFDTPEAAKRIAELELEYDKRVKYEETDAYIKELIKAFDVNTGDLDPDLANRGYESKHATGGKFKLVKGDKVIKSYSGKKSQSWD